MVIFVKTKIYNQNELKSRGIGESYYNNQFPEPFHVFCE